MTVTILDDLIEELIKDLQMENDVEHSGDGEYNLFFDDSLNIFAKEFPSSEIFLKSTIQMMPSVDNEGFFSYLMFNNLFFHGTGIGSLALDIKGENILFVSLAKIKTYDEFKNFLEKFLNYSSFWKSEIQSESFSVDSS